MKHAAAVLTGLLIGALSVLVYALPVIRANRVWFGHPLYK